MSGQHVSNCCCDRCEEADGSDARLEAGVYGDGWDQGVERTRGGPGGPSSKRATMFAPERGNLGPQERQYLSSLDRWVQSVRMTGPSPTAP